MQRLMVHSCRIMIAATLILCPLATEVVLRLRQIVIIVAAKAIFLGVAQDFDLGSVAQRCGEPWPRSWPSESPSTATKNVGGTVGGFTTSAAICG